MSRGTPPPRGPKKKSPGLLNRVTAVVAKSTKLVKAIKIAKFLKPILMLSSMAVSVFVYSFGLGLAFAAGFVIMLFVHEMGHVVALRRKGLPASLPVFIPMLGAAIFAPKLGERDEEAYVGIAGPIFGTIGAVALIIPLAVMSHPPEILSLVCYTALFINLFNMIPIRPLDGGRVTQAVGPWFRWVGVLMLFGLTVALQSPGLLLIWILILSDFKFKNRAAAGWTIQAVMAFLAFGHFGHVQPFWLNIVDQVFATIFNLMFTILPSEAWEEHDARPHIEPRLRWLWLCRYVALGCAIAVAMIVAHGFVPVHALK